MKRLFTVFCGVALALSIVGYFSQGSGLEAATPLPSGCYTDASGLPVCGPNYSPPPGPPSTPAAGNCISVSTPPAVGTITNTCTPTPFPSVTSTACAAAPAFAASTLSIPAGCQPSPLPSPQVTSTACSASPGVGPGALISIPAGCGGASPGPNVYLKSSSSLWSTIALGLGANHVYGFGDANGCNSISDAGGAPVPLPTPTTASTIVCGAPGVTSDGRTSVYLPGTAASGYVLVPASVLPTSGHFTLELCSKGPAWNVNGTISATTAERLFTIDSTATDLELTLFTNAIGSEFWGDNITLNSTNVNYLTLIGSETTIDRFIVWDGTHTTLYLNSDPVLVSSSAPGFNNGNAGAIGVQLSGGPTQPYLGRICGFAVYPSALTQAQIWTLVATLGL